MMDFIDEIKTLAARIPETLKFIQTEEVTKSALIMPFVRALGYNTEDPREVCQSLSQMRATRRERKLTMQS